MAINSYTLVKFNIISAFMAINVKLITIIANNSTIKLATIVSVIIVTINLFTLKPMKITLESYFPFQLFVLFILNFKVKELSNF